MDLILKNRQIAESCTTIEKRTNFIISNILSQNLQATPHNQVQQTRDHISYEHQQSSSRKWGEICTPTQRKKLARTTVNIQEKSCHTERLKAFLAVSLDFKECSTLLNYTSIGKKPLITHPHVNCKSIAKVEVSK
jgi:hypothetical protein